MKAHLCALILYRSLNINNLPGSSRGMLSATCCIPTVYLTHPFPILGRHPSTRRKSHGSGRCLQDDQGKRGQVRGSALHRHEGQGTARLGAGEGLRRGQVQGRACIRRILDRRLEGHRGLGHAAHAGRRVRAHGPVHGRADPEHFLRRARAVYRQGLRARPALHCQEGRSLPEELGTRRHGLFRTGTRILRLRRRRVESRHVRQLREDILRGSALVDRREVRGRKPGAPAAGEGRLLPRPPGGLAAGHPLGHVPCARGARRRGRGAPPRSGRAGSMRDRHEVRDTW